MIGICFVALVLLVWFKSDAVIEYYDALKLRGCIPIENYLVALNHGLDISFIEFLREHYNSFQVRLITCPLCLSTWTGLFFSLVSWSLPMWPVYTVLGLLLYLIVCKLL